MQRCFNLIHQISKNNKLTLIIAQDKEAFIKCLDYYPSLLDAEVISTKRSMPKRSFINFGIFKLQKAVRFRWYKRSLNGPADGLFLSYYPFLLKLLKQQRYDVVLLENLASLNAVSVVRRFDKTVKIIYDAHNVDSHLARVAVDKWNMEQATLQGIERAERTLNKTVDGVIACSQEDMDTFVQLNGGKLAAAVVPNGVQISELLCDAGVRMKDPDYILFCGTLSSLPNTEGLLWFYNNCWKELKNHFPLLKLLVVGSSEPPRSFEHLIVDESVIITGPVPDVKPWYNKAAISIVPLLSGSGTRLKILEAMSFGLPVISTSKGAEGISYINNENIVIADEASTFTTAIIALLKSRETRLNIQLAARSLVQAKYGWNLVGEALNTFLTSVVPLESEK